MALSFLIQQLSSYHYLTYNMGSTSYPTLCGKVSWPSEQALLLELKQFPLPNLLSHSSPSRVGVVRKTILYFKTTREVIFLIFAVSVIQMNPKPTL